MPVSLDPVPPSDSGNPPAPASNSSTAGGQAESASSPPGGMRPSVPPARSMLLLVVAAAVSAVLAAALVQQFGSPFRIPASATAGIGVTATPEEVARVTAAKRMRDGRNACVTFALIGAVLGLSFDFALGIGRRSGRGLAVGLVVGVLCGATFGAMGGAIAAEAAPAWFVSLETEHRTILTEALSWAVTSIGVGLGCFFSLRRPRALAAGVVAAFAGGLIGGALYMPVAALLLPSVDTELIIPDSFLARLVWISLPAMGMAFGMGRALVRNARR